MIWRGVERAIGGEQGKLLSGGEFREPRDHATLAPDAVALHLDEDVFRAECPREVGDLGPSRFVVIAIDAGHDRAFLIPGQGDEAGRKLSEVLPLNRSVLLGATKFGAGNETAEVLIARARLDEHGKDTLRVLVDARNRR